MLLPSFESSGDCKPRASRALFHGQLSAAATAQACRLESTLLVEVPLSGTLRRPQAPAFSSRAAGALIRAGVRCEQPQRAHITGSHRLLHGASRVHQGARVLCALQLLRVRQAGQLSKHTNEHISRRERHHRQHNRGNSFAAACCWTLVSCRARAC